MHESQQLETTQTVVPLAYFLHRKCYYLGQNTNNQTIKTLKIYFKVLYYYNTPFVLAVILLNYGENWLTFTLYTTVLMTEEKYSFHLQNIFSWGGEGQMMNVLLEEEATSVSFLVDHETVFRSLNCLG